MDLRVCPSNINVYGKHNVHTDKKTCNDGISLQNNFQNLKRVPASNVVAFTSSYNTEQTRRYRAQLARDLSIAKGYNVSPAALLSVVSKDELINILKTKNASNYAMSYDNAKDGVFNMDLHSHSKYSDGEGSIGYILDQAARYGDYLNKKCGGKFTFALTDHDSAEGVKEALMIISDNPKKFANLRFVPGIEMSYAHKAPRSNNECETQEILGYCINPFSPEIQNFVDNIRNKRQDMVDYFFERVNGKFHSNLNQDEFQEFYNHQMPDKHYIMNLHWKLNHYAQTKTAVSDMANKMRVNSSDLYANVMHKAGKGKSLGELRDMGLVPKDAQDNPFIENLRRRIEPHEGISEIVAAGENSIDDILNLSKDYNMLALAHPYFYEGRFDDPKVFLKQLIDSSNGKIEASESYHMAYPSFVKRDKLEDINSFLESIVKYPVGGRDSHESDLIPIDIAVSLYEK